MPAIIICHKVDVESLSEALHFKAILIDTRASRVNHSSMYLHTYNMCVAFQYINRGCTRVFTLHVTKRCTCCDEICRCNE